MCDVCTRLQCTICIAFAVVECVRTCTHSQNITVLLVADVLLLVVDLLLLIAATAVWHSPERVEQSDGYKKLSLVQLDSRLENQFTRLSSVCVSAK